MYRRSNWRDLKEWKKSGLSFSMSSDEACKLYDAALTQYVGYYNDPELGGLGKTLTRLLETDHTAVMGHVISLGLDVISSGKMPDYSLEFRKRVKTLMEVESNNKLTDWERRHVKGVQLLADGYMPEACHIWDDILLDYPLDILAIKFSFDVHIFRGVMEPIRNTLARVISQWTPDMPLYSYLLGYYSFSLCETNLFNKGEIIGKKGLELNPYDGWATHSLVHIYHMQGRYDEGIDLLETTVKNWEPQDIIACHNYWHLAVYKVEKAEYNEALDIFDNQVYPRTAKGQTAFNISDSSALLKRLEMEGVSVGERWHEVYKVCESQTSGGNKSAFYDAHFMMSALGAKQKTEAQKLMDDIREYMKQGNSLNHHVKREVGAAICESLMAYDEGDAARAVDLLYPLRYDIYKIGGSIAQRDVIHQLLIHAAMDSSQPHHQKIARGLLTERKALIETSPLTDRLLQKTLLAY